LLSARRPDTVTVLESGNNPLCTITLPATSCTFAPTTPGGQTLRAQYNGDANYGSAFSNALSFTVGPAASTTVTLVSVTPNPTMIDAATTATVLVDTIVALGPPTGTVTVLDGDSQSLCTITLPTTSCTFAPTTPGGQTVVAQYSGDASYASGLSNVLPLTVGPAVPVVTLVSVAPNPTAVGTVTTATVTVDTVVAFGPPTGTVTVLDGSGNSLCTITLPAASCAFAPTTPGDQTVVAQYSGDANYDNGLSNTLSLAVVAPPTIGKAFGVASLPLNETTALTVTLTNSNSGALTAVGFSDSLPAGLVVASPDGLSNTCGGAVTAVAGSSSVSLTGATLPASGSCAVVVHVTGTSAGTKNNTTGAVTSAETGPAGTASASLTVVAPPTIATAFGAASIVVNGTTTQSFTLTNPNAGTALTGVGFTDTLPAGLVVATPNGLASTCGGAVTADAGTGSVGLVNGGLPTGGSCTITLNVTGATAGAKDTTTSAVTSTEGGTGGTASAGLAVVGPPTIAKAFGAASLGLDETTTLTFTITNPAGNGAALTGVGFTDTLPAGLVVATPNGLEGSCGGGTITATAGASTTGLEGATLAAGTSCVFAINVQAVAAGPQANTTSAVTSANGGSGNAATASTTVSVVPIPTLSAFAQAVFVMVVLLSSLLLLRRRPTTGP
jgi:uncharacterized repeat protein (TIGR01451 family)